MIESKSNIRVEKLPEFDNHEFLIFFQDKESGLRGYIGIHNTNLGPATGGTRFLDYSNNLDAIKDVLNLSKAMSYKCALADVPFGGGKAVIIGNSKIKNRKFLLTYAQKIEELGGIFTTGTDVGMTDFDINIMSQKTKFVPIKNTKIQKYKTSDMAALGVFYSIEQSLVEKFNSRNLNNRVIAVKGVGKLGFELVNLLYKKGAKKVIISDIKKSQIQKVKKKYPNIGVVDYKNIHKIDCDVYSPCALGAEFNIKTVKELKAKIVCGGANNQLADPSIGKEFYKKRILYAPDYVVNAGGLINIVAEMEKGGYKKSKVEKKVSNIKHTLDNIFKISRNTQTPTNEVADNLARKIIYGKKKK